MPENNFVTFFLQVTLFSMKDDVLFYVNFKL